MSRYKPDPVVHADDWDADESATLKGTYSFLELERVRMHAAAIVQQPPVTNEEELTAACALFARFILDTYRSVTLRKVGTPYTEGQDRPRVDFSEEALVHEPAETLTWLVNTGMAHVGPMLTPAAPANLITPEAAEEGLTPANFPAGSPDPGSVPG